MYNDIKYDKKETTSLDNEFCKEYLEELNKERIFDPDISDFLEPFESYLKRGMSLSDLLNNIDILDIPKYLDNIDSNRISKYLKHFGTSGLNKHGTNGPSKDHTRGCINIIEKLISQYPLDGFNSSNFQKDIEKITGILPILARPSFQLRLKYLSTEFQVNNILLGFKNENEASQVIGKFKLYHVPFEKIDETHYEIKIPMYQNLFFSTLEALLNEKEPEIPSYYSNTKLFQKIKESVKVEPIAIFSEKLWGRHTIIFKSIEDANDFIKSIAELKDYSCKAQGCILNLNKDIMVKEDIWVKLFGKEYAVENSKIPYIKLNTVYFESNDKGNKLITSSDNSYFKLNNKVKDNNSTKPSSQLNFFKNNNVFDNNHLQKEINDQMNSNSSSKITPKDIETAFALDKGTILKYEKNILTCSEQINTNKIERQMQSCLKDNKNSGIILDHFNSKTTIKIAFGKSTFDLFVKEQCNKEVSTNIENKNDSQNFNLSLFNN